MIYTIARFYKVTKNDLLDMVKYKYIKKRMFRDLLPKVGEIVMFRYSKNAYLTCECLEVDEKKGAAKFVKKDVQLLK